MPAWPPFSSDEFLTALAGAYFPGARPRVVECEGRQYRTLIASRGKPVSGFHPFPFYLEPLAEPFEGPVLRVPHLREVVLATTPVGDPSPVRFAEPSPYVDLSQFGSWEELRASATPPPGINSPKRVEEKIRQAGRQFGAVELAVDDRDEADFETLLQWKIAQYNRTWRAHRMTIPQNLDFYRDLRRRGLFQVFALRFGGRLAAGKIGLRIRGRSLWRVTVYDPDFAKYSPGSIIEMLALKACLEAGERDYDYLVGAEKYKFVFATHIRWVGHVGAEPRIDRWQRVGRMRAARLATRSPALYRRLKGVERRVVDLRRRVPGRH